MTKFDKIKIEIKNDVTQFFGLIRKLHYHGFSQGIMEAMIGRAFWFDTPKNNLSTVINEFYYARIRKLKELNAEFETEK